MKKSLLLLASCLAFSALNAQDVLLNETFDDGTLGVFAEFSVVGEDQFWAARSFGDRQFAQMNGFDDGVQDNEDWLISPALDMDQYADEVLTFENAANFNGADLEILVSTNYDGESDPNTAEWTDLSDQVTFSGGGYEYVSSGEINLSGFEGTAYIAFKYVSSNVLQAKLWQLDNIMVTASVLSSTVENNPELLRIVNPGKGRLQFTAELPTEGTYSVLNLAGQMLCHGQLSKGGATVNVAMEDVPTGLYILHLQAGQQQYSRKFWLP